jgi:hypothetical protein
MAELRCYGVESWAENESRSAMEQARIEALQDMFAGGTVDIRKISAALAGRSIKKLIGKAKQNANETAAAATEAAADAARGAAMNAAIGEKLPFVDKQNYQTFAKAQGQDTVSRDVLKNRIVGMGNG